MNISLPKAGIEAPLFDPIAGAFSSESMPSDLIRGWVPVRVKKTRQNMRLEPPFRFNRNGKGSSSPNRL
jgi:hypothetical protein